MTRTRRISRVIGAAVCALFLLAVAGCGPSVSKLQEAKDVPGLVEIAEKPGQDFTKVSGAVDAIGEIGTPEAVEVLIGWVTADDDSLRTAAIPALGATGDPAGVEPLVSLMPALDPSDPNMYEMELRAIVIALGGIDDPGSAKALLAQADAGNSSVVGEAYLGRALAGQGDDIVPELKKRLASKGSDVYLPCGVALYILNAEDKTAVSKLLRSKKTQRVWAGVITEAGGYGFEADLIYALQKFGDQGLASRMLNSEDEQLEKAARSWASAHGYMVQDIFKFSPPPNQ